MIKDAEDFAEEDKKVAERAVAKVCNLYIGWFPKISIFFRIFLWKMDGNLKNFSERIGTICLLSQKPSCRWRKTRWQTRWRRKRNYQWRYWIHHRMARRIRRGNLYPTLVEIWKTHRIGRGVFLNCINVHLQKSKKIFRLPKLKKLKKWKKN